MDFHLKDYCEVGLLVFCLILDFLGLYTRSGKRSKSLETHPLLVLG